MSEKVTEIIFLLDRSGSMAGLEGDTIGGFNAFIEKQCELAGQTKLTTVLFDHAYELLWDSVDASEVKLTEKDYYVRGSTALLDAVGKTILNLLRRLPEKNGVPQLADQIIFVITTDGMENASMEFTYEKVKQLITYQQEHHGWEFIFMGANMDAIKEAGSFGISNENAHHFETNEAGVEMMYETIHETVKERRER